MPCEFGFNEVFICYLGAFTTNRRGVQHYGTLLQEMKGREVCLYQAHLGGSRFVDYGDDHDTTLTVLCATVSLLRAADCKFGDNTCIPQKSDGKACFGTHFGAM